MVDPVGSRSFRVETLGADPSMLDPLVVGPLVVNPAVERLELGFVFGPEK